jgi:1-acyl-sn-glycerol-3-phosphate acyltransferase
MKRAERSSMDDWHYKPATDLGLKPRDRWKSLRREAGLVGYTTQGCWRIIVASYLRLYHRLQIIGRENLPKSAPFILVANHSSHLDALLLGAAVPWKLRQSLFPIAAGDVFFETPAVSIFSAMMLNALPMWRHRCGSHAMQELRERLIGEPAIYVLFPEGTRSRDGQMGRFKPGIGMIVATTSVPIIPCHLSGAHAAFPPGVRLPRPLQIRLRVGSPCTFENVANERAGWQEIAQRLETEVAALEAAHTAT